ncbi:MAG: hybrid sensor histidine kinase/response regulator [Thermoanaerobaculia bacterium]
MATKTSKERIRELEEQLLEAQQTLDAIRNGQVDALVIEGTAGPTVFTLRTADHPYRVLIEEMQQGAITFVDERTIFYANRRFGEIVGMPLEEIVGRPIDRFLSPSAAERLRGLLRSVPCEGDLDIESNHGPVPIHLTAVNLVLDDVTTTAVIITDMTEQRKREEELQAERLGRIALEKTNRAKDEFLATVSHELRTPLTAILGWSSFLQHSDVSSDVRAGLKAIEQATRSQTRLVEDLLDVARASAGTLSLDPVVIAPDSVLDRAIATVAVAASAKKISIERSYARPLAPVYGDPGRLHQVFTNLLANAVKFTPDGGRIQIVVSVKEGRLSVSIRDTGCGIDPEFVPKLFSRFTQADPSMTRRHAGLGLGLSIARDLVELHGGEIAARSDGPGTGSEFIVTLPITIRSLGELERESSSIEALSPDALSGVRVLAIEDDDASRTWIARLLTTYGAEVISAKDSDEALARAAGESFDVILSDLAMPGCDGMALLPKLRVATGSKQVPAIALTAYGRAEDRKQVLAAGFDEFLQKPIDAITLAGTVARLYHSARP